MATNEPANGESAMIELILTLAIFGLIWGLIAGKRLTYAGLIA